MNNDTEINMNGPFGIFLKVFFTCIISLIVFVILMLGYSNLNYTGSYKVRTHTAERPSRSNEGQYDHVIEAVKKHEAKYKYIGDGDGF